MDELEKEGRGVIESERIPALFYINIWTRLRWEDDELGVGSPEHSGSREMDWIPADRVLLNEPVLVWYWKVANIATDPETRFNLISVLFIEPSGQLYIKKAL